MRRRETIDAAVGSAADTAADLADTGASQLRKFLDDVEDLVRRVSPLDDEDLGRMRNRVESSLKSVRKSADRQVRSALDASAKAVRVTDDYVRESPWKAIGIAAIAVLAVTSLVMSRRDR
ncbi:MAG: hypothetical protein ABI616_06145 [Pseudomonadota bacterium]